MYLINDHNNVNNTDSVSEIGYKILLDDVVVSNNSNSDDKGK